MKKTLSVILVLAALLSFGLNAFAAEPPVCSSAQEVDVASVLAWNSLDRILAAYGNIEMKYTLDQEQPQGKFSYNYTDYYYLIDGTYYTCATVEDRIYGGITESFYEFNPDDSYMYYLFPGGAADKQEYPAEYFEASLRTPVVPSPEEGWTLVVLSAEEADGAFVFTYTARCDADGSLTDSVTIFVDPATNLITGFKFGGSGDNAFGHVEYCYEGTVAYGVDSEPNYYVRG